MNAPGRITSTGPLIEAPLAFRLRSGGKPSKDDALVICPKCEAPCFIRKSDRVSERVKHILAHCTNTGCAHTFLLELVFVHSISPGLIDRPDLDLPICPSNRVPNVIPPRRDKDDGDQISMFSGDPPNILSG